MLVPARRSLHDEICGMERCLVETRIRLHPTIVLFVEADAAGGWRYMGPDAKSLELEPEDQDRSD